MYCETKQSSSRPLQSGLSIRKEFLILLLMSVCVTFHHSVLVHVVTINLREAIKKKENRVTV